ncbi:protein phosphatase Slingshot homolog 2 isoform X2 [Oncorhynchus tshawytscha]|uniref:protein phosphatase Slingshot homolog 2 isoform X2 n=1 Tax=Oncorhynchus tshawytscha TaxID=74940 RepID=UPI001C3E3E2A|nr:protein phosphatase Slingshot homolog 2 isoform X2 [Oncorhynchus tshawytscha]
MALVTVQRSPTPSTSSSPCVSESGSGEDDRRSQPRSISESFLTVKGAALFLPRGNGSSPTSASRFAQLRSKHAGDLQQHLQTMFTLLRPEDNIKLAVRLESTVYQGTRYMVVVSTNGRQDTEESLVLGMDFSPADSSCSVGLVLPLWSDSLIHLDGDGGFSVSTDNRIHVFKPVSVQAMWSALQSLHKACEVARCHNYFPGSLFLTWVSYYQSRVSSDQSRINEWNAMQDVQSHRADSPVMFSDVPTERERTERLIKTRLREIMMHKDLENVTCKEIRTELEVHMVCNLCEFKEYIDKEMILILGQMDSPTEIFDHVYLGSEWNASNLEELQNSGVQYILNVTREIDNFFPGVFEYHNIRVYDEEATDLLAYWNDTYKFISRARKAGAKCLVHCKMGVSRSASTVIAYAMKEYGWDLERAFNYVKERRAVTKPNPSFMRQLEEYQGILLASKQRHNKLWRSHSDSDLSEHHEPLCKTVQHPHTLGRSDPRNQGNSPAALSLQELLQPLGSPSNTGQVVRSISECGTPSSAGKVVQSSSQPNATATQENNLDTNQETRTDALLTSTTGDQSLGTGDQSLGTGDQSLGTGDQPLGTGDQPLGTGDQSLGTGDQSLWGPAIGHWGPAIGHWGPAIGHWGPAIGHWGPAIGHWGPESFNSSSYYCLHWFPGPRGVCVFPVTPSLQRPV